MRHAIYNSKNIITRAGINIYIAQPDISLLFESRVDTYADIVESLEPMVQQIRGARIRPCTNRDRLPGMKLPGFPVLVIDTAHDGDTVILGVAGIVNSYDPTPVWSLRASGWSGEAVEYKGSKEDAVALFRQVIRLGSKEVKAEMDKEAAA